MHNKISTIPIDFTRKPKEKHTHKYFHRSHKSQANKKGEKKNKSETFPMRVHTRIYVTINIKTKKKCHNRMGNCVNVTPQKKNKNKKQKGF